MAMHLFTMHTQNPINTTQGKAHTRVQTIEREGVLAATEDGRKGPWAARDKEYTGHQERRCGGSVDPTDSTVEKASHSVVR